MVDVNLASLARMTVSSSGTGTISLSAAVSGFLTFDLAGCSTASTGTVVRYAINDNTLSEIAYGTYTSSSLTLTRGSSSGGMKSTNSNSPINMSNAAQVFITPAALDHPFLVDTGNTTATTSLNVVIGGTLTVTGITTVGGGVTFGGAMSAAGEIRNTTSANASPFTQARITIYRDATNWGYLGYGNDAATRFVFSSTVTGGSLYFGTSTAVDNTGSFTPVVTFTAAGAGTFTGALTGASLATSGTLSVGSTATLGGAVTVAGAATLNGGLTVTAGGATINSLNVGSTITASGDITGKDIRAVRSATTGAYYFSNLDKYLYFDGADFYLNGGGIFYISGGARVGGNLFVSNNLFLGNSTTAAVAYFNSATTAYITWDGANWVIQGPTGAIFTNIPILTASYLKAGYSVPSGTLYLGNIGAYINFDGANMIMFGGYFHVHGSGVSVGNAIPVGLYGDNANVAIRTFGSSTIYLQSQSGGSTYGYINSSELYASGQINAGQRISSAVGYLCKQGIFGPFGNIFNIWWDGTAELFIDGTYIGDFVFTCDYRTKRDIRSMPSTWDKVKGLRPIVYRRADYGGLFKEGPEDRWGFLAHELQETLIETAASGIKDEEGRIQNPDMLAVLAATTKALQEAMGRIEVLEARLGG